MDKKIQLILLQITDDSPYVEDDYGRLNCFFCIQGNSESHDANCAYILAQEVLNEQERI